MARIICDTYFKKEKPCFAADPDGQFNKRITAINNMYDWLYKNSLLQNTAFLFQDLGDSVCFALDVKDLEPYRDKMQESRVEGAALAVHHIFDEAYTPCMYSGTIELGWFMSTYRNVDGCVGRSWECGLIQGLNNTAIFDVLQTKEESGVKAAVSKMFSYYNWPSRDQDSLAHQIQSAEGKKGTPDIASSDSKNAPERLP